MDFNQTVVLQSKVPDMGGYLNRKVAEVMECRNFGFRVGWGRLIDGVVKKRLNCVCYLRIRSHGGHTLGCGLFIAWMKRLGKWERGWRAGPYISRVGKPNQSRPNPANHKQTTWLSRRLDDARGRKHNTMCVCCSQITEYETEHFSQRLTLWKIHQERRKLAVIKPQISEGICFQPPKQYKKWLKAKHTAAITLLFQNLRYCISWNLSKHEEIHLAIMWWLKPAKQDRQGQECSD